MLSRLVRSTGLPLPLLLPGPPPCPLSLLLLLRRDKPSAAVVVAAAVMEEAEDFSASLLSGPPEQASAAPIRELCSSDEDSGCLFARRKCASMAAAMDCGVLPQRNPDHTICRDFKVEVARPCIGRWSQPDRVVMRDSIPIRGSSRGDGVKPSSRAHLSKGWPGQRTTCRGQRPSTIGIGFGRSGDQVRSHRGGTFRRRALLASLSGQLLSSVSRIRAGVTVLSP
jgi:hypothetical protein